MDNNDKDASYNPSSANYTYYGNNTSYHFLQPGGYQLNMTMNQLGTGAPVPKTHFQTISESTTTVMFPNSGVSVAASPQRAGQFSVVLQSPIRRDTFPAASTPRADQPPTPAAPMTPVNSRNGSNDSVFFRAGTPRPQ